MLASQRLYEKFDSDSDLKYYLDDENIINREGKHNSCDEDVIEVKYAEDGKFEQTLANAMEQIDKNGYAEVLKQDGMETIYKYGIAC